MIPTIPVASHSTTHRVKHDVPRAQLQAAASTNIYKRHRCVWPHHSAKDVARDQARRVYSGGGLCGVARSPGVGIYDVRGMTPARLAPCRAVQPLAAAMH